MIRSAARPSKNSASHQACMRSSLESHSRHIFTGAQLRAFPQKSRHNNIGGWNGAPLCRETHEPLETDSLSKISQSAAAGTITCKKLVHILYRASLSVVGVFLCADLFVWFYFPRFNWRITSIDK